MTHRIGIIGVGGFGREVFSLITALRERGSGWEVVGFFDDAPTAANARLVERLGSVIIGPVNALRTEERMAAVIAVGSCGARKIIASSLSDTEVMWPTLVHPDATVGLDNTLGPGTVVAAGARISTNVSAGAHVHIDQNVTIGHDVRLGDFSRLNPQACVSGDVSVGVGSLVGANSTILQGLRTGDDAVIGAGAVVVRDVTARQVVVGVPAHPLRSGGLGADRRAHRASIGEKANS